MVTHSRFGIFLEGAGHSNANHASMSVQGIEAYFDARK